MSGEIPLQNLHVAIILQGLVNVATNVQVARKAEYVYFLSRSATLTLDSSRKTDPWSAVNQSVSQSVAGGMLLPQTCRCHPDVPVSTQFETKIYPSLHKIKRTYLLQTLKVLTRNTAGSMTSVLLFVTSKTSASPCSFL